jgi:hypothetical protein
MLPQVCSKLRGIAEHLEREFHDMQEFEFTVEDGALVGGVELSVHAHAAKGVEIQPSCNQFAICLQ